MLPFLRYVFIVTAFLAALCCAVVALVLVAFWIDDLWPGAFWIPIVAIVLILLASYLLWSDEYDLGE